MILPLALKTTRKRLEGSHINFLYDVVEVRSKFQQQQFLGPQRFECHLFVVELLFL